MLICLPPVCLLTCRCHILCLQWCGSRWQVLGGCMASWVACRVCVGICAVFPNVANYFHMLCFLHLCNFSLWAHACMECGWAVKGLLQRCAVVECWCWQLDFSICKFSLFNIFLSDCWSLADLIMFILVLNFCCDFLMFSKCLVCDCLICIALKIKIKFHTLFCLKQTKEIALNQLLQYNFLIFFLYFALSDQICINFR